MKRLSTDLSLHWARICNWLKSRSTSLGRSNTGMAGTCVSVGVGVRVRYGKVAVAGIVGVRVDVGDDWSRDSVTVGEGESGVG
jgi:hypothetical protein